MTNQNILTYQAKVAQVEQTYLTPVSVLPAPLSSSIAETFVFLGKVTPWANNSNPDIPQQTQQYLKSVYSNIFVVKKVNANDISPVIPRYDWVSGTVYNYYQDNVDMFQLNSNGVVQNPFYVRNNYDQIFKCLWNNLNSPSTDQPLFTPGNYGANQIYSGKDGYQWKYMYTIDSGTKNKFMDSFWMPIPMGSNTLNSLSSSSGYGDIEVINVTNGGVGYQPSNSIINVVITGDGSGAVATAVANAQGSITSILVANTGSNYSYANVSIQSNIGSGATAIAPVSPIGGHGFNPITELGANHLMITSEFNGSENGVIPTDITYYQVGIIINPTALSTFPNYANASIYNTSTQIIVSSGFGNFQLTETVYQGTTLNNSTFTATVLDFDQANNILSLINTKGTPVTNQPILGSSSGAIRTSLTINYPDYQVFSGFLTYIENRSSIQRSSDGIEQFRFVVEY